MSAFSQLEGKVDKFDLLVKSDKEAIMKLYPNFGDFNKNNSVENRITFFGYDYDLVLPRQHDDRQDDKIFVSESEALERLHDFTFGLFEGMSWKNVVMAGGSMNFILSGKTEDWAKYPGTDVDLFVYGSTQEIEDTANTIVKHLREKLGEEKCLVFQSGDVATVVINDRKYKRSIQIINSKCKNFPDVLRAFDISASKAAFNGKIFLCMPEFIISMIISSVFCTRKILLLERLAKYHSRGFSIYVRKGSLITDLPLLFSDYGTVETEESKLKIMCNNIISIKNLKSLDLQNNKSVIRSKNKYFYPDGESVEYITNIIKLLLGSSYTLVTGDIKFFTKCFGPRNFAFDCSNQTICHKIINIKGCRTLRNIPLFYCKNKITNETEPFLLSDVTIRSFGDYEYSFFVRLENCHVDILSTICQMFLESLKSVDYISLCRKFQKSPIDQINFINSSKEGHKFIFLNLKKNSLVPIRKDLNIIDSEEFFNESIKTPLVCNIWINPQITIYDTREERNLKYKLVACDIIRKLSC